MVDSGYGCGNNFKAIEDKYVDPYIGDGKWEGKGKDLLDKEFGKDKFMIVLQIHIVVPKAKH